MTTVGPSHVMAELTAHRDAGDRLAALIGDGDIASGVTVHAVIASAGGYRIIDIELPAGQDRYPSVSAVYPGAAWYERLLSDLHGISPAGVVEPVPLVLPRAAAARPPSPGSGVPARPVELDDAALPPAVLGRGVLTIPYGPVRGGVVESVEYSVETSGEDILRLGIRLHAKHRGVESRFPSLGIDDGVLLAERVEGIASVAHAVAYCQAVEAICDAEVPMTAQLTRLVHAELERIANHLDVAMKAADGAALAVAASRFGWHKEQVLRTVNAWCGNRFGRGVVVPGGVELRRGTAQPPDGALADLDRLRRGIDRDFRALVETASFLDRMRTTGPLHTEDAMAHGALGPVARGSGYDDDARWHRPYGAYRYLPAQRGPRRTGGDALARLQVRHDEVAESFELIGHAIRRLYRADGAPRVVVHPTGGMAVGAAEAPQGEVLYLVRLDQDGTIRRCAPRSASLVNLSVFPLTFVGDIFTDFVFNEASFGVGIAGAAM